MSDTVPLKEWDFDAGPSGGYVLVEYPRHLVTDFVNWFRTGKQWRENPEMVYAQWLRFERQLTDARNAARAAKTRGPAPTPAPALSAPTAAEAEAALALDAAKKARNLINLAKARAARAAKKQEHATVGG